MNRKVVFQKLVVLLLIYHFTAGATSSLNRTTRSIEYLNEQRGEDIAALVRDREHLPEFQPLCQSVSLRVDLHEAGWEYRPPFYSTVVCRHSAAAQISSPQRQQLSTASQGCLRPGYMCVQKSRTILIAKRRAGTSCWSTLTRDIPSGCECMWPVGVYGDLRQHL